MHIDWKRKLTSRKFWVSLAGFVSMLIVALGKDAETAQTVTGLIMAGASLIAYVIGEGLADSGGDTLNFNSPNVFSEMEDEEE